MGGNRQQQQFRIDLGEEREPFRYCNEIRFANDISVSLDTGFNISVQKFVYKTKDPANSTAGSEI